MNRDIQGGQVFSTENDTDHIVAKVQWDGITRHYDCKLRCCDNPVCTCGTVHLSFSPLGNQNRNHPVPSHQVDIDVVRRQVVYKDESRVSKENRAFAKLLFSSLDDADFQFFVETLFRIQERKDGTGPN